MGPLLNFYLQVLQVLCTQCLGASVYPAQSNPRRSGQFALIHVQYHERLYTFTFYTNNAGIPRVYISDDVKLRKVYTEVSDVATWVSRMFDDSGVVTVSESFSLMGQLLAVLAREQDPFFYDLYNYNSEVLSDVFSGSTFSMQPFSNLVRDTGGYVFIFNHWTKDGDGLKVVLPFYLALQFNPDNQGELEYIQAGFELSSPALNLMVLDTRPKSVLKCFENWHRNMYKEVLFHVKRYGTSRYL